MVDRIASLVTRGLAVIINHHHGVRHQLAAVSQGSKTAVRSPFSAKNNCSVSLSAGRTLPTQCIAIVGRRLLSLYPTVQCVWLTMTAVKQLSDDKHIQMWRRDCRPLSAAFGRSEFRQD